MEVEHTGLLFLFTWQQTESSNFSRSAVNMRAQLLRKHLSRDFSSIRSGLNTYGYTCARRYVRFSGLAKKRGKDVH